MIHILPAYNVMSVLAGKTEGFVETHETSGTILIVRVCHQLSYLQQVQSTKYLGISCLTISDNLDWGQHVLEISC